MADNSNANADELSHTHHGEAHAHTHAHGHAGHGHGVHHEHHSATDTHAAANREHYDKHAANYETIPGALELCKNIGQMFVKEANGRFEKEKTEVLDFACGPGLISQELVPHAKRVPGVDISQGAVDIYNKRFTNKGLKPDEIRAESAELKGDAGELDGQKFDIITCSMAYHHFSDPAKMTRILASFLKPGGMLIIADGIKRDPSEPRVLPKGMENVPKEIIPHMQMFDENDIKGMFEGAGLEEVTYKHGLSQTFENTTMEIFVAKGLKPGAAA